jgi:hypothetical protein
MSDLCCFYWEQVAVAPKVLVLVSLLLSAAAAAAVDEDPVGTNFPKPVFAEPRRRLHGSAIGAIVLASLIVVALVSVIWYVCCCRKPDGGDAGVRRSDLELARRTG